MEDWYREYLDSFNDEEDKSYELKQEFPKEPKQTIRYYDREIGCYITEEIEQ